MSPANWNATRQTRYDLACLFGVRNSFGFRPVAEDPGFPDDASVGLSSDYAVYAGPGDTFGTTWVTWAEVTAVDWQETDSSGTRSRAAAAGDGSNWRRVRRVMGTLSEVHGAQNVRLVVWFH